jgi:hypothetical protein
MELFQVKRKSGAEGVYFLSIVFGNSSMHTAEILQLSQLLNHSDAGAVIDEIVRILNFHYPAEDVKKIHDAYFWIENLFVGKLPGYRECTTEYHNLGHTRDVLLATARLIDGHNLSKGLLARELALDLCSAALFHDTGYIQQDDDLEGTGAKYTSTHVERSMAFATTYVPALGIPSARADLIARLISNTRVQPGSEDSPENGEERHAGALLCAADLLGQMADRAYLEKLIFLYREMREAGLGDYKTEFDILRKTLGFYEVVRKRFDGPLMGVHDEVTPHFQKRYGIPRNLYMESIEHQMEYLKKIIADDTTNFRKKLKRIDLEKVSLARAADHP